ncbi:hypothetical protein GCM10009530_71240 [Microbispora corallina]|uniref:Anti-sigma factor antagonist n=1 Tax=Microbispora corallina TaxID=83302 RepID=A0ABQ4GAB9_9ACTN|nr:STAS domain-containing protein [Microbispora corallina]GIH44007.1 hypothetical protein Mco01_70070 [Microbispora corallina]
MPEQTDDGFRLVIFPHEECLVADVAGEVDYRNADRFQERVGAAWRETGDDRVLVIVLRELTFADSSALVVLARLLDQRHDSGRRLILAALPAYLERMMVISGLYEAFEVEPSLEAAMEAVRAA